jgi:hypothetical protein
VVDVDPRTYCTAAFTAAGTLCFIEIRRLRSGFMFMCRSGTRRSAPMVLSGTRKYWFEADWEEDDCGGTVVRAFTGFPDGGRAGAVGGGAAGCGTTWVS